MRKINDDKIIELYKKGYTHKKIAEFFNCATCTITNRLIKLGYRTVIPVDKELMIKLHLQGMTDGEIAKLLGCTRTNITHFLNKAGYTNRKNKDDNIELRNRISKSLIGRYVGKNNPNYKGTGDIKTLARGLFKTLSKDMMRNNNFTCSACGKRGGNLEVHHIKPFSKILDEFITNTYNGDITTLYEQLSNYPDFIDTSNLVVLCHDCHKGVHYSDNHELSPYRWESATTIERCSEQK